MICHFICYCHICVYLYDIIYLAFYICIMLTLCYLHFIFVLCRLDSDDCNLYNGNQENWVDKDIES